MNERVNYFLGCFFWLTLFMLTDCVLLISEKSPFHSVGSELLLQLVSVFCNSTWHAVQIAPVRYAGSRLTSRFDFINCGLIFHVWHDAHVCAYICVLYLKFTWYNSGDYCSAKWMRGLLNMKGFLECSDAHTLYGLLLLFFGVLVCLLQDFPPKLDFFLMDHIEPVLSNTIKKDKHKQSIQWNCEAAVERSVPYITVNLVWMNRLLLFYTA